MVRPEPDPVTGKYIARGYSAVGKEKISQDVYDDKGLENQRKVEDVKELFDMGPDKGTPSIREPNRFPREHLIPGFQEFMRDFYWEANSLSLQIQNCFALGLSLEENYFTDFHKDADNLFRLIHYPAVERRAIRSGEKARIPPHTDFGSLTILFQDNVGGLEVENPSKSKTYSMTCPPQL